MSSGSTIIMLSAASSAGGSDGGDVECRTCYGVVVACVSLLLFCVLAATAGVAKACDVTGFAVVLFGVVGLLLPYAATACSPLGGAAAAVVDDDDVPPAFAYECSAADAAGDEGGGNGKSAAASALCAVCLEDVRRGETVRRLPACGHLFHKECIDMWLRSHTTCPLCRCDLSPRRRQTTKSIVTTAAAPQSAADALPPV